MKYDGDRIGRVVSPHLKEDLKHLQQVYDITF